MINYKGRPLTEEQLVKILRSNEVDEDNNISDEYLINESYSLGEWEYTEFNIGDTVTLDRYNAVGEERKVKVVAFGEAFKGRISYKLAVEDVIICESAGISIMESKYYVPVPKEERHD